MHTLPPLLMLALPVVAAAQWTYVSSGTAAELRGLSVVDHRVAWASGARGTVARSIDGGRTWSADTVPGHGALDLRSIQAMSRGTAVVASAGEAARGQARMLVTDDGGRRWRETYTTSTPGVFLDAVAFWDARNGIALSDPVDGAFFVLSTSDGGRSWTPIPGDQFPRVLPGEAAFAASGSALAVHGSRDAWIGTGGGGQARVLRSSDRGRTWSVASAPVHAVGAAAGIFSLAFFSAKEGVAVGGDYTQPGLAAASVAITSDGGRTWRRAAAPPAAYLSGVAFAGSRRDVVAVGPAGTFVSRDGGDTWVRADTVPLHAVRFSGRAGFAVGPGGRIARMDRLP